MMMRWSALGLVLPGLLAVGCERRDAAEKAEPADDRLNVLLLTLDTTRADRLGCYGYAAAQTPALDDLAAAGVRFERAFCQVPLTLPSHVSLLTGTYPPTNGIRINAGGVLGDDVPTLAERFQRHGYRTGAFIAAWVLESSFGLDRGFDHYDDELGDARGTSGELAERRANEVCDRALAWLATDAGRPFFAWVHFFDPHHPYEPPEPYRQRLADAYDGEIAFMDSQVDRLLDWLEARKLRERTLIVVAGDHGEAFGEHEEIRHGLFVYDTTMRVPLILVWPRELPAGQVVRGPVPLVDVFPTIMELVGWDTPEGVEGLSLVSAARAGQTEGLPVYGETEYPRRSYGWAGLRSLTGACWKYIEAPRRELYDRALDPHEQTNVIADHAEEAARLHEELQELAAEMTPHTATPLTPDAAALRRLQSLGYVAGGSGWDEPDAEARPDPKDRVAAYHAHQQAVSHLGRGRFGEVIRIMEPLVRESPEAAEFHVTLGRAYLESGRVREAQAAYEASLKRDPHNPFKLWGLGEALRRQGRLDDAQASFEAALAISPDYPEGHCGLGLVYAARRDYDRAFEHCRRHLELSPASPVALTNLASIFRARRQPHEAVPLLRRALALDPQNQMAHQTLWSALAAAGREGEALAALWAAHRALPDSKTIATRLAFMLATTPLGAAQSAADALRLAEQSCRVPPVQPEDLDALAAACAAAGDFQRAVETADQALELAQAQGNHRLAEEITERLRRYAAGQPFVR